MYRTLLLLLLVLLAGAQTICYTNNHQEYLKSKYSKIEFYEKKANNKIIDFIQKKKVNSSTIHIPIVFHVLYNTQEQNISDAAIISQVKVLNETFSGANIDTSLIPFPFRGFIGKMNIKFHLAKVDPAGQPTNGIERVYTYVKAFSYTDSMKFDSTGGVPAWNPGAYLNVWICNLNGNIGYTQYPWEDTFSVKTSGVVIDYRYVGNYNNKSENYNEGKVLTHLVGHWLGLYHIYDNGCSGLDTSDCDIAGDNVCDTPPQSQPNYVCRNTLVNTCKEFDDRPDMTVNFMDMSPDMCRHMFTIGQVRRMIATLYLFRSSFLQTPPNLYHGIVATASIEPDRTCIKDTIKAKVIASDVPFMQRWQFLGSSYVSDTVKTTVKVVYNTPGTFSVRLVVVDSTGYSYIYEKNNIINVVEPNVTSLPLKEDFENSTSLPVNWEIYNPDTSITWQLVEFPGPRNSARSIYLNSYNYNVMGEKDELIAPYIYVNKPGVSLYFEHAYALYSAQGVSDSLLVMVSDNCEYSYDTLLVLWEDTIGSFATAPPTNLEFFPDSKNEWCFNSNYISNSCNLISLDKYYNKVVRIKFVSICNYQNNLFLDNIYIGDSITSIMDKNNAIFVDMYPNPSDGYLVIRSERDLFIFVYDLYGRELYRDFVSKYNNFLDLSFLSRGVYMIRFVGEGVDERRKIVIL